MADQLSLFGEASPPLPRRPERAPDRLLFVTYLSQDAASQAEALGIEIALREGLRGAAIRRDLLHVTLAHLGDHHGLPRALIAAGIAAGDTVRAYPFEAEFDRLTSFGREGHASPVVLWKRDDNNLPLKAFQQAISLSLRKAGLPAEKFNPHVTLRWDKANVPEQAITPVCWSVNAFALVHSLQGQATHVVLKSWSLRG